MHSRNKKQNIVCVIKEIISTMCPMRVRYTTLDILYICLPDFVSHFLHPETVYQSDSTIGIVCHHPQSTIIARAKRRQFTLQRFYPFRTKTRYYNILIFNCKRYERNVGMKNIVKSKKYDTVIMELKQYQLDL